ncbi:MAG: hypothetical protein HRT92_03205, partial [Piscirickettsiaceae bacterium]|nr:hypothetical protein [Piscirickettsiaceae bacterium]
DEKLAYEAARVDLKLIGSLKNCLYRLYQFNSCGHKQEITIWHVRNDNFRCQACLDDKLISEAAKAGLKLIGPGRSNQYRLYQFNSCGHKQELKTGHVRDNVFICNQCEDTAMTLPSTVYLIEVNYGSKAWLKLGYSKDIRHRIKGFGLPKTAHIAVLAVRPFDTGKEARRFEGGIHKKFFDEQLDMKQLHSISGGTECYPLLLKQRLLSII